jgi:hypothetical protein
MTEDLLEILPIVLCDSKRLAFLPSSDPVREVRRMSMRHEMPTRETRSEKATRVVGCSGVLSRRSRAPSLHRDTPIRTKVNFPDK